MEFMDLNDVQEETEENKELEPREDEQKPSKLKELLSWVLTFAIAIGLTLVLKNYVVISANIASGSMEDTIMTQDDVLGFRLAYLFAQPERGDIIIFKYPDDESQKFIKRVIGLPGERVVIKDAKIYINGSETPLDEPYLREEWVVGTGEYTFDIPEGCYLVLGDNRNDSKDARYWENTYVTKEEIIAKAEFVYYPFDHIKNLKTE